MRWNTLLPTFCCYAATAITIIFAVDLHGATMTSTEHRSKVIFSLILECFFTICMTTVFWVFEKYDKIAFSNRHYLHSQGVVLNHGIGNNPFELDNLQRWFTANAGVASSDCNSIETESLKALPTPDTAENSTGAHHSLERFVLDVSGLKLLDPICKGGGGAVWKATYFGQQVAVKEVFTQVRDAFDLTEIVSKLSREREREEKNCVAPQKFDLNL